MLFKTIRKVRTYQRLFIGITLMLFVMIMPFIWAARAISSHTTIAFSDVCVEITGFELFPLSICFFAFFYLGHRVPSLVLWEPERRSSMLAITYFALGILVLSVILYWVLNSWNLDGSVLIALEFSGLLANISLWTIVLVFAVLNMLQVHNIR